MRHDAAHGARRRFTRLAAFSVAGAAIVGGVLTLATLAWGYWSTGGAGTANVSVGTLSAPTGVTATATPGSATVPISWTGSVAPAGNRVDGYYVQRLAGSTASPACGSSPTALLRSTSTTCNDTVTADGTYAYRITSVFRSWTADSASSAPVNVIASTPKLAFVREPTAGSGGVVWASQPKVAVVDGLGNTVAVPSMQVTLSVTAGSGNAAGVLSCTANPKATVSGIAAFAGCKVNLAGAGYTLTASAPGYSNVVSDPFDVVVGPATKLVFTQAPSSVVAGQVWTPALQVAVQDAGSDVVTSSAPVALAFATNAGPGTLSGTLSVNASNGVASFGDLSVDVAASGYKLSATSVGLASATSAAITVNPGAPVRLVFVRQPGGGTGGVVWASQPKVAVADVLGNTVAVPSVQVTLTITAGSGNAAGVLSCVTNPDRTLSGVVAFTGCKLSLAGTGYTLTATAAGYPSVVSDPFNVAVGPAAKLVFTQAPSSVVAGQVWTPALQVAVQDAGSDVVTSSSAPVSLAFATNAGPGTLSGTLSVNASSGVASFGDLSVDVAASGYKLSASSVGLASATSAAITVNPGAPVRLLFVREPGTGTHAVAWASQPKVAVVDALGNTVTVPSVQVTLTITPGSGNAAGVLSCTANPKGTVTGVAIFAGCKISLAGTAYTLTASAPGYPSVVSDPFNLN